MDISDERVEVFTNSFDLRLGWLGVRMKALSMENWIGGS